MEYNTEECRYRLLDLGTMDTVIEVSDDQGRSEIVRYYDTSDYRDARGTLDLERLANELCPEDELEYFWTADEIAENWLPIREDTVRQYGENDVPALRERFNNWTDALCKEGLISNRMYHEMDNPE